MFLRDTSLLTMTMGLLPAVASAGPVQDSAADGHVIVKVEPPYSSIKLLYFDKKVDDGTTTEMVSGTETVGANDVRAVTKAYMKKVNHGSTYELLTTTATQFYTPADSTESVASTSTTTIIAGVKGPNDSTGQTRTDTVKMTTIVDGQLVGRDQQTSVKVLLKSPYEGMDPASILQQLTSKVAAES